MTTEDLRNLDVAGLFSVLHRVTAQRDALGAELDQHTHEYDGPLGRCEDCHATINDWQHRTARVILDEVAGTTWVTG